MLKKEFEQFASQVNICAVIDHSGRGGNTFLLSVFDDHPEVLCCPWMHYTYSYFVDVFGENDSVSSKEAYKFWTTKSYFKLIYQDLNEERTALIKKFGADPESAVDRALVREVFDSLVLAEETISRKQLFLATYFAFAKGIGRSVEKAKYFMVSDVVSLRTEYVLDGYTGKVVDRIVDDFPNAKLISLVRDPRATWASCRHQFVNQNGNMYGVHPANFIKRLIDLVGLKLTMDGCAYLFWVCYIGASVSTIYRLKSKYKSLFGTIRNEDLNLHFVPTMKALASWLDVKYLDTWVPDFSPNMVGKPWKGTGAYNSSYQSDKSGLLKNDPEKVARTITGPNKYVTERWKKRLARHEIAMLEVLFKPELADLGYKVLEAKRHAWFPFSLFLPFKGELPKPGWVLEQPGTRLFYLITLPLFYVVSRVSFLRIIYSRKLFSFARLETLKRIKAGE